MKQLATINPEDVSDKELEVYQVREAARAVITDHEGKIALLHVPKYQHYKTPGGGIEVGEDPITALKRECLEEAGCAIDDIEELGIITEYRKIFALKQISYCYTARVIGQKGLPHFTEDELEKGFTLIWLPLDQAIHAVESSKPLGVEGGKYIVPREELILKAAREQS